MSKDEVVKQLIDLNIIIQVSDNEYLITEKYKELLLKEKTLLSQVDPPKVSKISNYDQLLNGSTNGNDWPVEIQESVGRARAVAFMDACEVPAFKKSYRLRGIDKEALNIIGNIVSDKNIHPNTMIDAIRLYYKYTEYPKGFKNFLADGDILDVYNEHIAGTLLGSLTGNDNSSAINPGIWQ